MKVLFTTNFINDVVINTAGKSSVLFYSIEGCSITAEDILAESLTNFETENKRKKSQVKKLYNSTLTDILDFLFFA